MTHVVPCPSCRHPLQVRPDLLGRSVRCPACQAVFEAALPPSAESASPVVPTLSLDDGSDSVPAVPARNLWGAVEIESSGGGAPPPLPPARTPDPEPRPRPRSRDDELIRCPECGARLSAGSPRCVRCGARPDEDDRPRGRRPRREESEPHRGTAVLTIGVLSLVFSVCAPIGLTLGIVAWVMGQGDLAKMRRREMDREGQGPTTGGWICGIIGVGLSVIFGLITLLMFFAWSQENDGWNIRNPPNNGNWPAQRF